MKKVLSWVICLALVVSMLPQVAMFASATDWAGADATTIYDFTVGNGTLRDSFTEYGANNTNWKYNPQSYEGTDTGAGYNSNVGASGTKRLNYYNNAEDGFLAFNVKLPSKAGKYTPVLDYYGQLGGKTINFYILDKDTADIKEALKTATPAAWLRRPDSEKSNTSIKKNLNNAIEISEELAGQEAILVLKLDGTFVDSQRWTGRYGILAYKFTLSGLAPVKLASIEVTADKIYLNPVDATVVLSVLGAMTDGSTADLRDATIVYENLTPDFITLNDSFVTFKAAGEAQVRVTVTLDDVTVYDDLIITCSASQSNIVGSGTCGTNLTWTLDDEGTLTISGTGAMTNWLSSSSVPWYSSRASVKKVIIEDGVTSIGNYAFYEYNSLASITIPDSVTSIGSQMFFGCSSLGNITIPDSVTSIDYRAFYGCSSLTSVAIPDSVTSIEKDAFRGCSSLMSVTIPDSVTSIGSSAFSDCSSLESITIPESVTSIGNWAFYKCSSLTSVTIPDGVTSIGSQMFYDCTSLESITIPDSLTSIASLAFSGCRNIKVVYITDLSAWLNINFESSASNPLSFGANLCLNGEVVTDLVIPDSVTSIGDYAFYGCTSLTSVTIPDSVTSIGENAFYGCTSLTSVTIPDGVTSIEKYAFSGCTSIENVYITDLLAWLNISFASSASNPLYCGANLCLNGEAVTDLVIPEGVTSIGNYAFRSCISIKSVTIPDSVTSIGVEGFGFCSRVKNITIGSGLTSIGAAAFKYCHPEFIYYFGTPEQWNEIDIASNNEHLTANATIYYDLAVSGISIDKTELELYRGDEATLTARVEPSNTMYQTVLWSSSNESVATVSNGVVTAVGSGTATITATTEDGGYTASCAVTVNKFEPTFSTSMNANLTLEANVFLNIYFKLENLGNVAPETLEDRVGLLIWDADALPSDATYKNCKRIIKGAEYNSSDGYFKARTEGIPAKELGDALSFRAYFKNDDGTYTYGKIVSNYCPSTYCYRQMMDFDISDDELMVAILNYGAAAQEFFDYRTDSLMNANLSAAQKTINWDGSLVRSDWSVPASKAGNLVMSDKINMRSANLTLLGAIDYNFYIGVKSSVNVAKAEILCWTEEDYNAATTLTKENASLIANMEYNSKEKRYEYKYAGLPAKKMFSPIYTCAVITDSEGNEYYGGVVPYCPERFAYISTNSNVTEAEKNLAKSLAIYGNAARNYFN